MQLLKQSTAATVKLGPFVDSTDGVTAETGLTISQADIRLSKGGGAFAQTNNATGATHDENGWYGVPLDTTDTATLGRLTVAIAESGALPVWAEYLVVPANVYDSLVSGSDYLQADAVQVEGADATDTILGAIVDDATQIDASALNALSALAPGSTIAAATDIPAADITAILADTNELQTDDIPGLIAALNDPSAATIADAVWDEAATGHTDAGKAGEQLWTDVDAILADTNELQTDDIPGAISALNDPTAAAIADAVWDEAATGHTDAGKAGEQLWTDVDAILADTNELQTDDIPGTIAALNNLSAAEVTADMDANSTQLAAIVADTNELQTDDIPGLIAALENISAAEVNAEVVDVLRTDTIPDSIAADGSASTIAQAIYLMLQFLTEKAVSGTTVTVNKPDGTTALATFTLDDGTSPTSITRTT